MSLSTWVDLCKAAGINVDPLTPLQVHELGGRIIKDEELTKLVVPSELVDGVLRKGVRSRVLRAMPEHEKAALRKRIGL